MKVATEVLKDLVHEHKVNVEEFSLNVDPDVTFEGRPVILSTSLGRCISVSVDGYGELSDELKVLLAGRIN
ncbi:MAG: hypothetical protein DRJ97_03750 [Thermoprotei archaeon]|nr:MAG: hypothetical protein DRJ97_03750 [Thermoprotei archaeon]